MSSSPPSHPCPSSDFSLDSENNSYDQHSSSSQSQDDTLFLPPPPPQPIHKTTHTTLTHTHITQIIHQKAEQVALILSLSVAQAKQLLPKYKYQAENVIEAVMENEEKIMKEAGITAIQHENQKEYECGICAENATQTILLIQCQHRFCRKCWTHQATMMINDEAHVHIKCMYGQQCKSIIDEDCIRMIVDAKTLARYRHLLDH